MIIDNGGDIFLRVDDIMVNRQTMVVESGVPIVTRNSELIYTVE